MSMNEPIRTNACGSSEYEEVKTDMDNCNAKLPYAIPLASKASRR